MKNLFSLALVLASIVSHGQYRIQSSSGFEHPFQTHSKNKASAFTKLEVAPHFIQYTNSGSYSAQGYWKGLSITTSSSNGLFSTKYLYDVQGNLQETKTYLHIKSKGRQTNWSIQYLNSGNNGNRRSAPLFIHTF